jgi:DNA-binding transcriptional ArsR family regulator
MVDILEVLFSSAARVHVLGLFLRHPGSQFYQREIERETGQPIRAVQREVERLEGIDLLLRSEEGNRVYYRLNPEFPLLAGLMALFPKAAGMESVVEVEPARFLPPEPSTIGQPFAWMETLPVPPLPAALRRMQVEGEWDRAY